MRLAITLAAVAALSACGLNIEQRRALADAVIVQIEGLEAEGVDLAKLDAEKLAYLNFGCGVAPAVYPERAADIAAACDVIKAAAQ